MLPQMKTFYSPVHREHAPKQEFEQGRLAPAVEIPERVERVRARIAERKLGPILAPSAFDDAAIIRRVHDGEFVSFLAGAHADWRARYGETLSTPFRRAGRRGECAKRGAATSNPNWEHIPSTRRHRSPKGHGVQRAPASMSALSAAEAVADGRTQRLRADAAARPSREPGRLLAAIAISTMSPSRRNG